MPDPAATVRRLAKVVLAAAIIAGIGYFLGRTMVGSWAAIDTARRSAQYRWLLVAYLPLAASFAIGVSAWRYILSTLGARLPWDRCFWTISGSHLAKFIPGHVLALGGRIWLCGREGVPTAVSTTGVVLEMLSQLAASALVFVCYALFPGHGVNALYGLLGVVLAAALAAAAHPSVLRRIWHLVPRYGRASAGHLDYRYRAVLALIGLYVLAWALQGLGVYLLARSLCPGLGLAAAVPVIGSYGGAYALGFLSIVTPGGLGVREGALSYLLSSYLPLPQAVLVAVLSRLWLTSFDIVMTIASLRFSTTGAPHGEA